MLFVHPYPYLLLEGVGYIGERAFALVLLGSSLVVACSTRIQCCHLCFVPLHPGQPAETRESLPAVYQSERSGSCGELAQRRPLLWSLVYYAKGEKVVSKRPNSCKT